MRKTESSTDSGSRRLSVSTRDLQAMLGCGRDTACRIGTDAGARMQIGRRVLWNVDRVQRYLDTISEAAATEA